MFILSKLLKVGNCYAITINSQKVQCSHKNLAFYIFLQKLILMI